MLTTGAQGAKLVPSAVPCVVIWDIFKAIVCNLVKQYFLTQNCPESYDECIIISQCLMCVCRHCLKQFNVQKLKLSFKFIVTYFLHQH